MKSIFDILIGLVLVNAGETVLDLNLNQLKHHSDARDAMLCYTMLAPVSYCEPTLNLVYMYPHTCGGGS